MLGSVAVWSEVFNLGGAVVKAAHVKPCVAVIAQDNWFPVFVVEGQINGQVNATIALITSCPIPQTNIRVVGQEDICSSIVCRGFVQRVHDLNLAQLVCDVLFVNVDGILQSRVAGNDTFAYLKLNASIGLAPVLFVSARPFILLVRNVGIAE